MVCIAFRVIAVPHLDWWRKRFDRWSLCLLPRHLPHQVLLWSIPLHRNAWIAAIEFRQHKFLHFFFHKDGTSHQESSHHEKPGKITKSHPFAGQSMQLYCKHQQIKWYRFLAWSRSPSAPSGATCCEAPKCQGDSWVARCEHSKSGFYTFLSSLQIRNLLSSWEKLSNQSHLLINHALTKHLRDVDAPHTSMILQSIFQDQSWFKVKSCVETTNPFEKWFRRQLIRSVQSLSERVTRPIGTLLEIDLARHRFAQRKTLEQEFIVSLLEKVLKRWIGSVLRFTKIA